MRWSRPDTRAIWTGSSAIPHWRTEGPPGSNTSTTKREWPLSISRPCAPRPNRRHREPPADLPMEDLAAEAGTDRDTVQAQPNSGGYAAGTFQFTETYDRTMETVA